MPLAALEEQGQIRRAGAGPSTVYRRPQAYMQVKRNMDKKPANGTVVNQGLMTVLDVASRQLSAVGMDCILIGGFAVNYYGYTRNTLDVDFMIVTQQFDGVSQIMKRSGFTNIASNKNVAFFNAPGSPLRADFLRVDGDTMRKLLGNAINATVYGYEIKVPALQDLIAMKIFDLAQDLDRRLRNDLPDIAYLSVLQNLDLESDIRPL